MRLRKEVLPKIEEVREVLAKSVRSMGLPTNDPQAYRERIHQWKADLAKAQESLAAAWRTLGITGSLAAGAGAGAGGLAWIVLPDPMLKTIGTILSVIVGAGAVLRQEIAALYGARHAVRKHPLFYFDRLPSRVRDVATGWAVPPEPSGSG